MELTGKELAWLEKMANEHFYFFCQSLMPPNWYDDKFHRELCDFLQYGGNYKVVVLARTHLKTTICAVMYPLWCSSRRPSLRSLEVSNTSPNAEKTVHSIRTIVENNSLYQVLFPQCIPNFTKVRWSDRCACLSRKEDYPEGTFESAGVGANIIRRHFNVIVEDDTVAPRKDDMSGEECMPSKDDIEQAVGFHRLTTPLLIGEEYDEQLVIGTRWSSYDHIQWIQENEPKYKVFDRKAEVDGVPAYKRFSRDRLDSIRMSMGTYLYSSLYLNTPLAKEFMVFNPDWIKYYEDSELPEEGECVVTLDPADPPTGKKTQNYTAIVSVKHTKKGLYVRRYRRKRYTDKEMINETFDVCAVDGAVKIRIETNRYANLEAGFREEMKRRNTYYIVETVKATRGSKEERIKDRLSPLFENGVIFLKRDMREMEEELSTFPYGKFDDLIDSLAWQVKQHTSTQYPQAQKEKVPLNSGERRVFTLEEIRASCRGQHKIPYPFQSQMEPMM